MKNLYYKPLLDFRYGDFMYTFFCPDRYKLTHVVMYMNQKPLPSMAAHYALSNKILGQSIGPIIGAKQASELFEY